MPRSSQERIFTIITLVLTISVCASAANLKVHCGRTGEDGYSSINAALQKLNVQGPNTLTVSGTCNENLMIRSMDRLTLISKTGASITDASQGNLPVVEIEDSRSVSLQGFSISGGDDNVFCNTASTCYLQGNTLQDSLGQEAVAVAGGSNAFLQGNVIQNNMQRGLTVANGSQAHSVGDAFNGNVSAAIVVNSGAYLQATSATVQNNGSDGSPAIVATDRSSLRLISCTVTNNAGEGVRLQHSAEARFDPYLGPTTVSNNGGNGVTVEDLSFALFGQSTITGNLSGTDVLCSAQFPATRGALTNIGGGTTNCVEP